MTRPDWHWWGLVFFAATWPAGWVAALIFRALAGDMAARVVGQ